MAEIQNTEYVLLYVCSLHTLYYIKLNVIHR